MTAKPSYIIHTLPEKAMTVDWFFGRGHLGIKIKHFILIVIGWLAALTPVAFTTWALINRDSGKSVGGSGRAFVIWDQTMAFLAFFLSFFIVFYLGLFIANKLSMKRRNQRRTYDEERLRRRIEVAEDMYVEKFGPRELRVNDAHVQIQPYGDIETYELRGRYRNYGGE